MLIPGGWTDGGASSQAAPLIDNIRSLTGILDDRIQELRDIAVWFDAYFQAVAIMLQLPGGTGYHWLCEDPDDADDFVWAADRDMLLSILAQALEHLEAEAVMDQIPGSDSYKPRRVPTEFQLKLARRDGNGVLNLVATCLDRLMVIPEMPARMQERYGTLESSPGFWRRCWRGAATRLSKLIPRRKRK
ncbi:MAG: hypothetical protein IIB57_16095 [Planctomycetes bacterium]|nr:hypothetical protein [Planctomycetota bacterium]